MSSCSSPRSLLRPSYSPPSLYRLRARQVNHPLYPLWDPLPSAAQISTSPSLVPFSRGRKASSTSPSWSVAPLILYVLSSTLPTSVERIPTDRFYRDLSARSPLECPTQPIPTIDHCRGATKASIHYETPNLPSVGVRSLYRPLTPSSTNPPFHLIHLLGPLPLHTSASNGSTRSPAVPSTAESRQYPRCLRCPLLMSARNR